MSEHRYILEPYKGMNTRYHCPRCQHTEKTLSRYIDTETGEHLHPNVGRCNRESNCGYHYTPKQYFQDNRVSFDTPQSKAFKPRPVAPQPKPVSFIPDDVFKASLNFTAFESNHFVQYLINLFGVAVTSKLVSRYFIGTSKHWNGSTVFWQIDSKGKIRTGKIMLYNPVTGRRVKAPFNHISWAHCVLKQPNFTLRQCFFGEHLLNDRTKPVAIVESEKTAVIASVYLPLFIWLAVGSLNNLNIEKCGVLKGRTVSLFPDLNGFEKWRTKAKELSHIANFQVSDLLERKATVAERKEGLDIADYLTRFNYRDFVSPEATIIKKHLAIQPITDSTELEKTIRQEAVIDSVFKWHTSEVLSETELINGIIYEHRKIKFGNNQSGLIERAKPCTDQEIYRANEEIRYAVQSKTLIQVNNNLFHLPLMNPYQ